MQKAIEEAKNARVLNTKPTLAIEEYTGKYYSRMYGDIVVDKSSEDLVLEFSHAPALSARLEHWHYNTWEIEWDETHAWFDFGTVQFLLDNNLEVTGMHIDVPNNDIFFHELEISKQ